MINLETEYLGLNLRNPLVASSSGLTNSIYKLEALEKSGIGAIVLKSLFEEQMMAEVSNLLNNPEGDYPEASDYVAAYVKSRSVEQYLNLIHEARQSVSVPIIASINCFSMGEWIKLAKDIELAGADAIELNIFFLNSGVYASALEYEQQYYKITKEVSASVSIPVAVKISPYFSNTITVVNGLKANGAKGVVLFNKFYQPDIDIQKLSLVSGEVFSHKHDFYQTLRWVALTSGLISKFDISASTGVHEWESVVKMLLAGASTVQLCSVLYQQGNGIVSQFITCLEEWMNQQGFNNIADYKGRLNLGQASDPVVYERSQFMRYYASRD